jgi:hypothetical protein
VPETSWGFCRTCGWHGELRLEEGTAAPECSKCKAGPVTVQDIRWLKEAHGLLPAKEARA